MKKILYILLYLISSANCFSQENQRHVSAKNAFVAAVNNGHDSALYMGKRLIKELEAENPKHPFLPRVYLSTGNFYLDRDRLPEAINYYQKTLDIAEQLNDSMYIAFANGSIGNVHVKTKKYKDALPVFRKNLNIWKKKEVKDLIPVALTNIGRVLLEIGELSSALDTLHEGLLFSEQNNITAKKSDLSYYVAKVHLKHKNNKEALKWAKKSREDVPENDKLQFYKSTLLIAEIQILFSNWNAADSLCKWTYNNLKNETKFRAEFLASCNCLVNTNKELGDENSALAYKWEYINQRDVLNKLYQLNQLDQIELEHELHKKLMFDSMALVNKQQEIEFKQQLDKDRFTLFNWLALMLCLLIVVTGFYVYKSYQKQKQTFKQLAEINKEITDSINYAKHIQDAFLPNENELKNFFKDSFLLYEPKEIVAGDFYWFDVQEGKMLLAVADCSGYGVPGAMISVVCYGALHEAVRTLGLGDTSKILNLTQQLIAKRFELEDEKMQDGMDISLCVIDSATNKIKFSGANNSMLLIRNNELIELKGDKQTIGNIDEVKPFSTQEIQGEKNDAIYLFSDGYANQLGGEKGKKLKSTSLKKELVKLSSYGMNKQLSELKSNFEHWKADYEQVDDICAVGVRL